MLQSSLSFKSSRLDSQPVAMELLCDWMEASLLFGKSKRLSLPEVVEFLVDEQLCSDQEEGWGAVNAARLSLRRRARLLGAGYPFSIEEHRLVRNKNWNQIPGYSFCLLLSLRRIYPAWWIAHFDADHNAQGELFEKLALSALEKLLAGWNIHKTGWSRNAAATITTIVNEVADLLGEPVGDIQRWIALSAKDAGLDILCFRKFYDGRGGVPIFLVQCASGKDFEHKLSSPDLNVWTKLVQFSADPKRAFVTPLTFVDEEFSRHACRVQGLVLDRYRLLEPMRRRGRFINTELSKELVSWTKARVSGLPWDA